MTLWLRGYGRRKLALLENLMPDTLNAPITFYSTTFIQHKQPEHDDRNRSTLIILFGAWLGPKVISRLITCFQNHDFVF